MGGGGGGPAHMCGLYSTVVVHKSKVLFWHWWACETHVVMW